MSFKSKLFFGATTFTYGMFLTMAPGYTADLAAPADPCAVSGFNGKLSGAGGFYDSDANDGERIQGEASLSLPLGCLLGLQFDGAVADLGGEDAAGVGAHLFARDPNQYLFGAFASYSAIDNVDVWRVGAEAQLYLDNISLETLAGFEDADITSGDFFTVSNVAFYPTDDLRLSVGYQRFQEVDALAAGFEWQVNGLGLPLSLFAKGAVGDNDLATAYAGLTLYFGGGEKSLIRRHREDDPENTLMELLVEKDAAAAPPPSPITPPSPLL